MSDLDEESKSSSDEEEEEEGGATKSPVKRKAFEITCLEIQAMSGKPIMTIHDTTNYTFLTLKRILVKEYNKKMFGSIDKKKWCKDVALMQNRKRLVHVPTDGIVNMAPIFPTSYELWVLDQPKKYRFSTSTFITMEFIMTFELREFAHSIDANKNFTFDLVDMFPTWRWNSGLSRHHNLTKDIVLRHPQIRWSWYDLVHHHDDFALDIFDLWPDKGWPMELISQKPNLTFDLVQRHQTNQWHLFLSNPILFKEILTKLPNVFPKHRLASMLSYDGRLTMDFVRQHSYLPWDLERVAIHRAFEASIVRSFPDWKWPWKTLSGRVPLDLILELSSKPWNFKKVVEFASPEDQKRLLNHGTKINWDYS